MFAHLWIAIQYWIVGLLLSVIASTTAELLALGRHARWRTMIHRITVLNITLAILSDVVFGCNVVPDPILVVALLFWSPTTAVVRLPWLIIYHILIIRVAFFCLRRWIDRHEPILRALGQFVGKRAAIDDLIQAAKGQMTRNERRRVERLQKKMAKRMVA